MNTIIMRCPTQEEYYQLCSVTRERDDLMHWRDVLSWVNTKTEEKDLDRLPYKALCGMDGALHHYTSLATSRDSINGFRPAIENPDSNFLVPNKDGSVILGTLYMNCQPIRIPKEPTYEGGIVTFVPGARLEMCSPLEDPAYQVRGFKVSDDTYIADRVILTHISYDDIVASTTRTPVCELPFGDGTLKIYTSGVKYAMYIEDPDGVSHVMDLYASPKLFMGKTLRRYMASIVSEDRCGYELMFPHSLLAPGNIEPVIQLPDGRLYCRKCKVYVENTANAEMRKEGAFSHSHVCED